MLKNITNSKVYYLRNVNFWICGFFSFFYFFIMAICFPWLPVWAVDNLHLTNSDVGLLFAAVSFFALLFQPVFGFISDRLVLKKYLMAAIVALLILFAPFFIYLFGPLLQHHLFWGILAGGIYIGFAFAAGCGVMEAYIEKCSRRFHFEYGIARAFGNPGWGICSLIAAGLFSLNPHYMFWIASALALVLAGLLFGVDAGRDSQGGPQTTPSAFPRRHGLTLEQAMTLFRDRRFWLFMLFTMGVPCVYEVYDQQFATFFKSFFINKEEGTRMFGYATTLCEAGNALVMFLTPWILSKAGVKKTLIIAGLVMTVRITGSAFATSAQAVFALKLLHAFELPLYVIGSFKYITTTFDVRLSATIYLIGYQFSKQAGNMLLSAYAGRLYDTIGFHSAYLILGSIVLGVTMISMFTLDNGKIKHPQPAVTFS